MNGQKGVELLHYDLVTMNSAILWVNYFMNYFCNAIIYLLP